MYSEGKIVNWATGFEDGGANVNARMFPVKWFDKDGSWGWVEARHLRVFPGHCPNKKLAKHFARAKSWMRMRQRSDQGQDGWGINSSHIAAGM